MSPRQVLPTPQISNVMILIFFVFVIPVLKCFAAFLLLFLTYTLSSYPVISGDGGPANASQIISPICSESPAMSSTRDNQGKFL